jgi:hypothetical protein
MRLVIKGGKRPLRRQRRIGLDNIKMDLIQIGGGGMTGLIWLKIEIG